MNEKITNLQERSNSFNRNPQSSKMASDGFFSFSNTNKNPSEPKEESPKKKGNQICSANRPQRLKKHQKANSFNCDIESVLQEKKAKAKDNSIRKCSSISSAVGRVEKGAAEKTISDTSIQSQSHKKMQGSFITEFAGPSSYRSATPTEEKSEMFITNQNSGFSSQKGFL